MVSYSGRFILWSTTSLVRTRKLVCEVGKDEEGNLRRLSVITIHLVRRQIQIPSETASLLIKNETALQQSPKGKRSSHPFPTQTCNFSLYVFKSWKETQPRGEDPTPSGLRRFPGSASNWQFSSRTGRHPAGLGLGWGWLTVKRKRGGEKGE